MFTVVIMESCSFDKHFYYNRILVFYQTINLYFIRAEKIIFVDVPI